MTLELKPLTTAQIAEYCHVTHRAVLKWIAAGKLKAYRTPGKHARVSPNDFVSFLKVYNFPIPKGFENLSDSRKILVVDDDKEIVSMIRRILLLKKFDVHVAYDGFSAGAKLMDVKPDLMLVDIRMPQMDGYSVITMIREELKNNEIKIICMSGGDDEDLIKARTLGANDTVAKPFDHKELVEKINHLLGIVNENA